MRLNLGATIQPSDIKRERFAAEKRWEICKTRRPSENAIRSSDNSPVVERSNSFGRSAALSQDSDLPRKNWAQNCVIVIATHIGYFHSRTVLGPTILLLGDWYSQIATTNSNERNLLHSNGILAVCDYFGASDYLQHPAFDKKSCPITLATIQ